MYDTHQETALYHLMTYVGHRVAVCRQLSLEKPVGPQLRNLRGSIAQAREHQTPLPDLVWVEALGLSDLEHELLWLACAPHLEPGSLDEVLAKGRSMSVAVAMKILAPHAPLRAELRRALQPEAPLRAAGLLYVTGPSVGLGELLPAPHVLHALDGRRALSEACSTVARLYRSEVTLEQVDLPPVLRSMALPALRALWETQPDEPWFGPGGVDMPRGLGVVLRAPRGQGTALSARALAGSLGRGVLEVQGEALARRSEASGLVAELCREAALHGELLVVRDAQVVCGVESALASVWAHHLRGCPLPLLLCWTEDVPVSARLRGYTSLRLDLTRSWSAQQQAMLWQMHLPAHWNLEARVVEALTQRFALMPGQVKGACHLLSLHAPPKGVEAAVEPPEVMVYAARQQLQADHTGQVSHVSREVNLSDLILPPETHEEVGRLVHAISSRRQILDGWGLRATLGRGVGLSALFDGDPGTGKTLAAEAIAGQCGMELMQVDTSSIVDKYIGETEKNLTSLFQQARPDLHILLFDEADSLFGKRTEVRHATDRYANMNINTLLQLIERYEGITILTTNLKRSIDPAFERRLTFKISFPTPGFEERAQIWRRLLSPLIPTAEAIDYDALAEVELTGGEIKNALLQAAYRAAREASLMMSRHLLDAAVAEARSSGRLVRMEGRG